MVSSRKRKSTSTPTELKKAKAQEEARPCAEVETPKKDEHEVGEDVAVDLKAAVTGNDNASTSFTVNSCEDGDVRTETEPLANDDVNSSEDIKTGKEGGVYLEDLQSSIGGASNAVATPSKPTPTKPTPTKPTPTKPNTADAVSDPGSRVGDKNKVTLVAQSDVQPLEVAPIITADTVIEEKGEVSSLYVGRVIGKGGEMIRDLQARSGCKIDVDQNVPHDAPRVIAYRGTRATIDFAKRLMAILCTENGKDADLPLGQAATKKVQVSGAVIGKIIGRKGEMIRKLQNTSQAKIQVDHSAGKDSNHRQVTITGMKDSVIKAEEMILFLCVNPGVDSMQALQMLIGEKRNGGVWGSGPPYPNLPNQGEGMPADGLMGSMSNGGGGYSNTSVGYGNGIGATETDMFPCAKMYMGRVIGQKGATINDLQKRSGCDIQINQNFPAGENCQITITGSRQGVDTAKRMLYEIIETGANHPYAGGSSQGGQLGNAQGRHQSFEQQPYHQMSVANQSYQQQGNSHRYDGGSQQQNLRQSTYQPQPYQSQPYQSHHGYRHALQNDAPAPGGQAYPWRSASAGDGQIYYYNQITQETQWDRPAGMY